jgi:negative regulator of sigma E activity
MSLSSKNLNQLLEQVGLHKDTPLEELQSERTLTDNALRTLAPVHAPEDLSLRIRLALSHERVRAERRILGRIQDRWESFRENSLRPFALQGAVMTAALVATIGGALLLGAVAPQQAVEANDEPLTGFSAPRFLYSAAAEQPVASAGEEPLMVQAMVDTKGRVYDYRVLSGQLDETAATALRQRMLTGVFQPAQIFGQPVRGRVVLTFADVVVRG